jgi:hypothetical protein
MYPYLLGKYQAFCARYFFVINQKFRVLFVYPIDENNDMTGVTVGDWRCGGNDPRN